MPNWFLITQPLLVVAALAAAAGALAMLRLARSPLAMTTPQRKFAAAGGVGVVLLLASLIAVAGSALANLLLMAAAWIAGIALVKELYRSRPSSVSDDVATYCIVLRSVSLLCLLLLVAAPVWQWIDVELEKPRMAVLLDQSQSMSIRDPLASAPGDPTAAPTRRDIANAAIQGARPAIAKLAEYYDIQPLTFGQEVAFANVWKIDATDAVTAVGAALRRASAARNARGEAPAMILALSDGAENTADPLIVRQAAEELAAQRIGLVAVGIGATAAEAAGVVIEPLSIPARIGTRDRLRVPVVARVMGCNQLSVRVELQWDDLPSEGRSVRLNESPARLRTEFDTTPPGAGLRRVTTKITLPSERGGASFERAAIVDVRDEAIRIAIVEPQPRSESAFIRRALEADARYDVTQILRSSEKGADPTVWETHDVILLGNVGSPRLTREELRAIARAVQNRGVGLMLMGGPEFFSSPQTAATDLNEISPVELGQPQPVRSEPAVFRPSEAGLLHAILQLQTPGTATQASTRATAVELDAKAWERLAPLTESAVLGKPRALAQVLAEGAGRPLLVAHEVGRGRVLATAWQATWPWALGSDEGAELHRRMWRQIVAWLANRRPTAWVVTDQATYQTAALLSGQQQIRVRAGVSADEAGDAAQGYSAKMTLRTRPAIATSTATSAAASAPSSLPTARGEATWDVPLTRASGRWEAILPRAIASAAWIRGGEFELEFVVEPRGGGATVTPADRSRLTARTLLTLQAVELEFRAPTANLDLLADAAQITAEHGGFYAPISQLDTALRKLIEKDPRRKIERLRTYEPLRDWAWILLATAATALCGEWWLRRSVAMR
ncbi:MAG: hypothetical protein ACKVS9_07770 [Phycisphaerae bacterium]